MEKTFALFLCLLSFFVHAQEAVYKCGNEYTNDSAKAKRDKCKVLEREAQVSVPASRLGVGSQDGQARRTQQARPNAQAQKPKSIEQQARDTDAKSVIASEIKKTESEIERLQMQYNNGKPTRSATESETQYTERTLALKNQITRAQADLVSLKREMGRP